MGRCPPGLSRGRSRRPLRPQHDRVLSLHPVRRRHRHRLDRARGRSGARATSAWAAPSIAPANVCRCPCSAGTVTRAPSSSTKPSGATASAMASPSPEAAPTERTTAPTSSRRTAPLSGGGSAMIAYATKPAYAALHAVYRLLRLHVNFFQPVQKLVDRVRVEAQSPPRLRSRPDAVSTPLCHRRAQARSARGARPAVSQPQSRSSSAGSSMRRWSGSGRSRLRRHPSPSGISAMSRPAATFAQWAQDRTDLGPTHTWDIPPPAPLARAVRPRPLGNRHL